MWNKLDLNIKSAQTLLSFKSKLKGRDTRPPLFYFSGSRKCQIIHAQLRLKCSSLKEHLYLNHVVEDAKCECGHRVESPEHFFWHCTIFNAERTATIDSLDTRSTNTLLQGDFRLSHEENTHIFQTVHNYILMTDHLYV